MSGKRNNNDSVIFELYNFIYMILEGMSADSIHLVGRGLNAVSADSIHLIGCGLNAVSVDSIHLTGCGLNAVNADSIHLIPFSRCHGRSVSRRFLFAML